MSNEKSQLSSWLFSCLDKLCCPTTEPARHNADELPHLLPAEQAIYRALRQNAWERAVRLEQERVGWAVAEVALAGALKGR